MIAVSFHPITTKRAVFGVVLMECLIILHAIVAYDHATEVWQAIARLSGRLSLLVFSAIFVLKGSTSSQWLPPRAFFVFAIAHGIHLIELLIYITLSQRELIPIRLAGGFVAYLIVFVMPWIEHQFEKGKLSSSAMEIYENVSLYYIWFIFLMAYIPRVLGKLPGVGGNMIEFITLLGITLAIFVWRFTRQIRNYIVKK
ncbi:hypothetical protein [Pseudochryseolinea flava]|uniref:Uncharacterized protein n=1 Tax=Pseudochryseolinea flava TaxID=2059302 RepID=A0A364Y1J3_9BACT|nr:hypothetical protein [Pseudochryseolinea flava]RAW00703.1 hypothetical protein DQQ10_14050 [Pseudochryseolinea flava]